jgi:hypothetical protein
LYQKIRLVLLNKDPGTSPSLGPLTLFEDEIKVMKDFNWAGMTLVKVSSARHGW